MKARSSSSRNGMSLCKGQSRQLYHMTTNCKNLGISQSLNINAKNQKSAQLTNNFVLANKKNLRNFFKDRIPQSTFAMFEQNVCVSPSKIFNLRKEQFQKQKQTEITLHKSFVQKPKVPSPIKAKLNQTFQIFSKSKNGDSHQKTETIKRSKFQSCESTMYECPTKSSLMKRSKTLKKKVYISVFGEGMNYDRAKPQMVQISSESNLEKSRKIGLKKKREQLDSPTKLDEQRDKLSTLLMKIQQFGRFINPHRLPYNPEEQNPKEFQFKKKDKQKEEMLNQIRGLSSAYKQRNIQLRTVKIKTLEDIQKVDPSYYAQMKNHKLARLVKKNKALQNSQLKELFKENRQYRNFQSFQINEFSHIEARDESKLDENWTDNMITITERNTNKNTIRVQEENFQGQPSQQNLFFLSFEKRLTFVRNSIINSINLSKLYEIDLQNIFQVLIKKRKGFQLEGSYSFFKFIKLDNLDMVQNFVQNNSEYLYQVDKEGRSTLIYAIQNNSLKVANYLLCLDFNFDLASTKGLTALYYALRKDSYQITQLLLRRGASPWSTKYVNIDIILKQCCKQIRVAVKNARKVDIGRRLQRNFKQKWKFWQNNKRRIQGRNVISF